MNTTADGAAQRLVAIAKDRIETKLHYIPESGCHIFIGFQNEKGYGRLKIGGRNYQTHRLSWMIHRGEIEDGMQVLHKCDTPSCCNPDHLMIGSNQDNIDDAVAKGRRFTKLTPSQVAEIRQGKESIRSFARKFSVARSTVFEAKYGHTWNKCLREEYER